MSPHPLHAGPRRLADAKRASLIALLIVAAAPLIGAACALLSIWVRQ